MTEIGSSKLISLNTLILMRRIMLVLLLILLGYSIYLVDVYWIASSFTAIVVIVYARPSPSASGDEGSKRSYRGVAMIMYAEVAKSNDPRQQLREKIEMMMEEGKINHEGIVEILTFLKKQKREIGDEAGILLSSLENDVDDLSNGD